MVRLDWVGGSRAGVGAVYLLHCHVGDACIYDVLLGCEVVMRCSPLPPHLRCVIQPLKVLRVVPINIGVLKNA